MDMTPIAWQVIALTPSDWSLNMITPFLSRSFRRIVHSEKEGKIVKNISAAQNLEVTPFISPPHFSIHRVCITRSKIAHGMFSVTKERSLKRPLQMTVTIMETTHKLRKVDQSPLMKRWWWCLQK